MELGPPGDRRYVVLCGHVAGKTHPPLRAVRDEPIDNVDSGWQVLCNSGAEERVEEAKLWAVEEVVALAPGLSPFLHLPAGTVVVRESEASAWRRVR